jgi:hypothetical protein
MKKGFQATPRDLAAVRWIAEQGVVRQDHLTTLLDRLNPESDSFSLRQASKIRARWIRQGWADYRRYLYGQQSWTWITDAGHTAIGSELRGYTPQPGARLEHNHARNAARLYWEAQGYEVIGSRTLAAELRQEGRRGAKEVPHLLVHKDGSTIAIQVELSPKTLTRWTQILNERAQNYDSTILYTNDRNAQALHKLQDDPRTEGLIICHHHLECAVTEELRTEGLSSSWGRIDVRPLSEIPSVSLTQHSPERLSEPESPSDAPK